MRSYEAARSYFNLLSFLSWCVITIGAITAILAVAALGEMSRSFGGSPVAGLAAVVPGVAIMFAGFMGLVFVQIGRAGVDSAEYAQQSLQLSREQLEISRQSLNQSLRGEQGYAAIQAAKQELRSDAEPTATVLAAGYGSTKDAVKAEPEERHEPGEILEYHGKNIRVVEGGYVVGGTIFETFGKAKEQIENDGLTIEAKSSAPKPYSEQLGVNEAANLGGVTRP